MAMSLNLVMSLPNSRPSDTGVRQRTLDPTQSFIVQAPAGSGKTELLIRRFLVLLARAQAPEEVVAITFTRKAAYEMRERVLDALQSVNGSGSPDSPDSKAPIDSQLQRLATAAMAQNHARGWGLEQQPSRLCIRTFDSICRMLIERMPWLSRFGAPPVIVNDVASLYRDAAHATLALLGDREAHWSESVEALLMHLDNDLPKITQLVLDMLARRDQWMRHASTQGDPNKTRAALEDAWTRVVQAALHDLCAAIPSELAAEMIPCASFAASQLTAAGKNTSIVQCAGLRWPAAADPADLPSWQGLADLLLTQTGKWRRRVDVNIGFPSTRDANAVEMKHRMQKLLRDLSCQGQLLSALTLVRRLPNPRFSDTQWKILAALLELLPLAVAHLQVSFRDRGQVDFLEIAQRAVDSLGRPDDPTDLALVMDYRIRHILVDEFQDTSRLQFDLLWKLTAGWQRGDGRSLFLVGDPMQSIFGFRDADVGLYLQAERVGIGAIPLEPLRLAANFRSSAEIVHWVNSTFEHVFPASSNILLGAVTYCQAEPVQTHTGPAVVQIHPLLTSDRGVEAERVLQLLEATQTQDDVGSVAILARSRTDLTQILRRLQQQGIQYRGVDLEPLRYKVVVQDLLSLARALLHPADSVAWFAILRAPWCGLTLSDLLRLAGERPRESTVWERLSNADDTAELSVDGRRRACRVRDILRDALVQRGRLGLRDWVEQVWIALGGPACVDAHGLDDAEAVLRLMEQHQSGADIVDFKALHAALDELWARPRSEAGVHVMTIHKAKGLEFDTVIVPGLGRSPSADKERLLLWSERVVGQGDNELLLAPLGETGRKPDQAHVYLKQLERDKSALELGRLCYVACTRAKRSLHLLGHTTIDGNGELVIPGKRTLLHELWPALKPHFVAAVAADANPASTDEPKHGVSVVENGVSPIYRVPADWSPLQATWHPQRLAQPADAVEFEWASDTARHIGTVVHRLLYRLAEGAGDSSVLRGHHMIGTYRSMLRGLGVPQPEVDQAADRVNEAIHRVCADARAQWILSGAHAEAHSEYALTGLHQGELIRVVIDRTFVDEHDTRWIVDFKTSSHEGADIDDFLDREVQRYREQLELYAVMMKARDARPIRLALYFPLMTGWREWTMEMGECGGTHHTGI